MKPSPPSLLLLLLLFLLPGIRQAAGQFYVRGQDPASIRWQQIETPHFRLIFPQEIASQASYAADLLEYMHGPASESIGRRPRRVPVILHNHGVVPNGFVSWAPARMELFTTPPPDDGPHDWLERLAVHEFRHVVQVSKLNQGITRLMSLLLGEQALGISLGLFVPMWLLEGDAVVMETALTHGGRGRMPSFEQGLRAQLVERGAYTYEKAMLGSLKDHVPNFYELGYQLVASARVAHGPGIWGRVLSNIALRPYTVNPLAFGLKRETGAGTRRYYAQTMQMLDSLWTEQLQQESYTPFRALSPESELYSHYRSLAFIGDSTLMALRTGMDGIPRVVSIGLDGEESGLFIPGFYNTNAFSAGGGVIAWSETRPDPRWAHRSWSEIHLHELGSASTRRLTRGTRLFSPALTADGRLIAATEVSLTNDYALVILDAGSGELVARMSLPGNDYLMSPSWHPGGGQILAIARNESGKRIVLADTATGDFTTLFHAGHTEISRPRYLSADKVAFTGAFSGVDNIYVLDPASGEVSRLVSSRFGAVDAVLSPGGDLLLWSGYSSLGYRAVAHEGPLPRFLPLDRVTDHSVGFHRTLAAQENMTVGKSRVARTEHQIKDYSRAANLFNFHSWGPYALHLNTMEVEPGFSLLSQNLLSTSLTALGYAFDPVERLGRYYLNYSYLGFYPVVDLEMGSGLRRSYYTTQQDPGTPVEFLWRQREASLGLSLPLAYRKGPWLLGVNSSVRSGLLHAGRASDTPSFLREHSVHTLGYRVSAYRQIRSVGRDIRPRLGQALSVEFRHAPFGSSDMGWVAGIRAMGLFPGLGSHHSLRLTASYQEHRPGTPERDRINFRFPNLLPYPRGTAARRDDAVYGLGLDYAFPLAYPDRAIPHIVYLKRLRTNFFTDYARTRRTVQQEGSPSIRVNEQLLSVGLDLIADVHLLGFFSPMEVGVRSIYLPYEGEAAFRLLFAFGLY